MHRFRYKLSFVLIAVLLLIMTFTNLPSKADDIITVKKSKVILYLGGCKGTTSDGTKAKYYTLAKVRKLMYGFDKNTYDIVLKSDSESVASVDSKKDIIYAEGIGETYVDVTIKRKKTGKTGKKDIVFSTRIKVVVKQNADEDSFFVNGLENGQSFFEGDTVTVSMPGDYTDLRLVESDDEEIIIKALNDGISYNIEFPEVGKYLITAASYQSKKYNGFVVSKEFEITVKERPLEVCQIGSECIRIKGNFSDQEIENDDFTVFEDKDGAYYFYSYVSEVAANRDSLDLKLFIPLESEKDYILEYEGLQYKLHSEPCDIKDVYSFEINENVIQTGENTVLTYSYFNKNGLDISKSVSQKLDPMVELKLKDENTFDGFVSGNSIYIIKENVEIEICASLLLDQKDESNVSKKLETEKKITAQNKNGNWFTGNTYFTITKDDKKYLKIGDKVSYSVPIGDSVVIEALFEMEDGKWKSFDEAGVSSLQTGNASIAMIGKKTGSGGYQLLINNVGNTSVIAYCEEKVVGVFDITILPERRYSELKVEITKNHLNTNVLADDYIIIKADRLDQYGEPMDGGDYTISQTDFSKKVLGEVQFEKIANGRYVLRGSDCKAAKEEKNLIAVVTSGEYSKNICIMVRDVNCELNSGDCKYSLKLDGSRLIDTALLLDDSEPVSSFITIEITKNGYYIGEGVGYIFDEYPSNKNGSDYYSTEPGEIIYGLLVEYTSDKGIKSLVNEETPCIISSYMDLEFAPYIYNEKLKTGNYEISVYSIKTEKEKSTINKCDSLNIRVIDTTPDVEVEQIAQTYSEKPKKGWENAITDYFTFKYDGEDISKYITKVACVEASSGSVFVKSVEFQLENQYYGVFTLTAEVERLITKQ